MRFTADQRHFENQFALLLQTCDKSWCLTLGGEMKSCVSLQTNDISRINLHYHCRRMTKVAVTPWEVNCKCSLVPSEKHTFVFEISRFFNFLKIFQLLSHVCMNMAIQTANVHWSPAGSILFFTSQGG